MKKISLLIFCLGLSTTIIYVIASSISPPTFSEKVCYRYYLVKRLKKNVQLLLSLETQAIKNLDHFDPSIFKHKLTKNAAIAVVQKKTILPIKNLWKHFFSYHLLDDNLFINEFVQQILMLYFFCNQETNTKTHINTEQLLPQLLDSIDLLAQKFTPNKSCPLVDRKNIARENEGLSVENITKRFYIIQRLKPIMPPLLGINTKSKSFKGAIHHLDQTMKMLDNTFFFSNNNIQALVNTVCTYQTIDPIDHLWREVKNYKHILNDTFIREALTVIFLLYQYLSTEHVSKQDYKQISDETMAMLNSHNNGIDITTIDKILEKIEKASNQFTSMQTAQNSAYYYTEIIFYTTLIMGTIGTFFYAKDMLDY